MSRLRDNRNTAVGTSVGMLTITAYAFLRGPLDGWQLLSISAGSVFWLGVQFWREIAEDTARHQNREQPE